MAGDGSLSFLGVAYPDARIARVRITSGSAALGAAVNDVTQGGTDDLVVMDDFIYGEPLAFDPVLTIAPPSGTYTAQQSFDLVLIVNGPGRTITGGTITFDGADVAAALVGCLVPGRLDSTGQTFRCPGVPIGIAGPGTHTLAVTLTFDDGSIAKDRAVYVVSASTEP